MRDTSITPTATNQGRPVRIGPKLPLTVVEASIVALDNVNRTYCLEVTVPYDPGFSVSPWSCPGTCSWC